MGTKYQFLFFGKYRYRITLFINPYFLFPSEHTTSLMYNKVPLWPAIISNRKQNYAEMNLINEDIC